MKEKVTSRYDFVYFSSKISSKDKKISFLFFFFYGKCYIGYEKSSCEIIAISLLAKISFTDCDKIFRRKPEFKAEQFRTNDFFPWIFKNITIINFSLPLPFVGFNLLNVSVALLLCLNMFESNV